LGSGYANGAVFPCLMDKGFVPIDGSEIICTLDTSGTGTVRVKNFKAITAGTTVGLYLAKVKNPATTYNIQIGVGIIENGNQKK